MPACFSRMSTFMNPVHSFRAPETWYNAAFPRFPSNTIYDPLPEQMGCELPFLLNVNISKTNYGNASERCFCANENTTGSLYDFIRLVKALFCYGVASLSLSVTLSLSLCLHVNWKINTHTHTCKWKHIACSIWNLRFAYGQENTANMGGKRKIKSRCIQS